MTYKGTIIEESLENKEVLKDVDILSTNVEPATDKHQTPWVQKWTLRKVEIAPEKVDKVARKLAQSLDPEHSHSWYADFKDAATHFIVFRNKVFKIDRHNKEQYDEARQYGLSLGIPEHQINFHLDAVKGKR